MSIELVERSVDEFRARQGKAKTEIWKQNKQEIIAQALKDEGRKRDRDEFLNRNK